MDIQSELMIAKELVVNFATYANFFEKRRVVICFQQKYPLMGKQFEKIIDGAGHE